MQGARVSRKTLYPRAKGCHLALEAKRSCDMALLIGRVEHRGQKGNAAIQRCVVDALVSVLAATSRTCGTVDPKLSGVCRSVHPKVAKRRLDILLDHSTPHVSPRTTAEINSGGEERQLCGNYCRARVIMVPRGQFGQVMNCNVVN